MHLNFLPFLFLGGVAQAAMVQPLNDMKVIEVPISRQGLTRITVQGHRILNVFGVTGEYVLEADEDQGQIFIRPLGPGAFKPISLTLTTEKGHTQDLRLVPQDQPPEALILKAGDEVSNQGTLTRSDAIHDNLTRDAIETLLQACREDRIPLGYKLVPVDLSQGAAPLDLLTNKEKKRAKFPNFTPLLVKEIRSEAPALGQKTRGLRCLIFEVKNTSSTPMVLSESEFSEIYSETTLQKINGEALTRSHIVAILSPHKHLTSGERSTVYVVAKLGD